MEIEAVIERHNGVRRAAAWWCATMSRNAGTSRRTQYRFRCRQLPSGVPTSCRTAYLLRMLTRMKHGRSIEIFEDNIYLAEGVCLNDGCCVLDVGANIGLFTMFVHHHRGCARLCIRACRHCFQPTAGQRW